MWTDQNALGRPVDSNTTGYLPVGRYVFRCHCLIVVNSYLIIVVWYGRFSERRALSLESLKRETGTGRDFATSNVPLFTGIKKKCVCSVYVDRVHCRLLASRNLDRFLCLIHNVHTGSVQLFVFFKSIGNWSCFPLSYLYKPSVANFIVGFVIRNQIIHTLLIWRFKSTVLWISFQR